MTLAAEKIADTPSLSKLYELMEQTWGYALDTFDPESEMLIKFLAQEADGGLSIYVTPWQNDFDKTMILNMLRKQFKEKGIQRYVLMSEVWTASYSDKAERDKAVEDRLMPRDHPNRVEKLMLLGVDPGAAEVMQYAAIITKDAEGKRVLGAREVLEAAVKTAGVMTELLGEFTPRSVQ